MIQNVQRKIYKKQIPENIKMTPRKEFLAAEISLISFFK